LKYAGQISLCLTIASKALMIYTKNLKLNYLPASNNNMQKFIS